jgi:hypothetical protein
MCKNSKKIQIFLQIAVLIATINQSAPIQSVRILNLTKSLRKETSENMEKRRFKKDSYLDKGRASYSWTLKSTKDLPWTKFARAKPTKTLGKLKTGFRAFCSKKTSRAKAVRP